MLVPHIALRYECRIYSYGAISTTTRRKLGWIKKGKSPNDAAHPSVTVLEEEESGWVRLRRKSWARFQSST